MHQVDIQRQIIGDEVVLTIRSNYWRFRHIFDDHDFVVHRFGFPTPESTIHVCNLYVRITYSLVFGQRSAEEVNPPRVRSLSAKLLPICYLGRPRLSLVSSSQ